MEISLINFNDDNHAERIWFDGKYVGDMSNFDKVIKNILEHSKRIKGIIEGIESTHLYVCDDFDELDEEQLDEICDYFYDVGEMTNQEIEYIQNKDWEKLLKYLN